MIKLIRFIMRIKLRERIPKLPRGMLASPYDAINEDERRVMARMGIRSPSGLRLAMKRYKAASVDELVSNLKHYQPRRRPLARLAQMIGRLIGTHNYDPHRADMRKEFRRTPEDKTLQNHVKFVSKRFHND